MSNLEGKPPIHGPWGNKLQPERDLQTHSISISSEDIYHQLQTDLKHLRQILEIARLKHVIELDASKGAGKGLLLKMKQLEIETEIETWIEKKEAEVREYWEKREELLKEFYPPRTGRAVDACDYIDKLYSQE